MGTIRGLWITRRVPLYTVTFPSKHLLQIPTERIWPPQINSPTRRTVSTLISRLSPVQRQSEAVPFSLHASGSQATGYYKGRRCFIHLGGERVAGTSTTDTGTVRVLGYRPCSTV